MHGVRKHEFDGQSTVCLRNKRMNQKDTFIRVELNNSV